MTLPFLRNPRVARWLGSPPMRWACVLLLPLSVSAYCMASMGIAPNVTGCIDHVIFALAFAVLYALALCVRSRFWRQTLSFLGIVLATFLCFATVLYFRFFQSWPHVDIFEQTGDLPHIWSGILALLKPWDFFLVLVPLFLWRSTLVRSDALRRPVVLALVMFAGILFVAHRNLAARGLPYPEHHPVLWFVRQSVHQAQLRKKADLAMREISRDVDAFRPRNRTVYRSAGLERFPFAKTPYSEIPKLSCSIAGQPNVVLVLMESVRSLESGAYGARPSFTPNLDQLAKEGVVFRNFYANGSQTVRGEFALLASFLPKYLGGPVYLTLPNLHTLTLPAILKERGYKTMWISSFSPKFHNKKGFLATHGIDEFHADVPEGSEKIGWGPADTVMFDYAFDLLSRQDGPFFAEIMTLSNHFPFDWPYPTIPDTPQVNGDKLYQGYARGIFYTDAAIGRFMSRVRKSAWGKDTLFIFTSDHGIWLFPSDPTLDSVRRQEAYFRVPLIFWAPKLLEPDTSVTIGSQLDVAPTVLDLLDIHVDNAFLGTSLLRQDVERRFVFMVHDGRWNLRIGNEFAYDAGPELFAEHFPFAEDQGVGHAPHRFFRYAGDFLRGPQWRDCDELPVDRQRELQRFAERTLGAYFHTLVTDRVWPAER